jgi:AmmeMemoRadiSam system protein B
MKKNIRYIITFVVIAFAIGYFFASKNKPISTKPQETRNATYNKKDYYPTLEKSTVNNVFEKKVYAGIVSHHQLVAPLISNFYLRLKKQKIKTVIILGPAHFYSGSGSAFVTEKNYNTPWGILELDRVLSKDLIKSGVVRVEEQAFEGEHSIGLQVGYIKAVFPDVKILPIVLKRGQRLENLQSLSKQINSLNKENLLVLASLDFAHHVDNKTAKAQDQESLRYLNSIDFDSAKKINVDSQESLYVLLNYLFIPKSSYKFDYTNTNAAEFINNLNLSDVTSYFFGYYYKD